MFTIPQPIAIAEVKDFMSDEVHITGKLGSPRAVLSFVAVDVDGKRVGSAPVAVVTLTGEAFNKFYSEWTSETNLYKSVLKIVSENTPGAEVSGVDLAKVSGVLTATDADEVLATS